MSRDFQRSKVYDAEHALTRAIDLADRTGVRTCEVFGSTLELPVEYKFRDLADVQHYCDRALAAVGWTGPGVEVVAAHPNQVRAHYVAGRIHMPRRDVEPWAWRETVVLHELAHFVSAGDRHGPLFTGSLLALMTEMIGPEMALYLRSLYDVTGARVNDAARATWDNTNNANNSRGVSS